MQIKMSDWIWKIFTMILGVVIVPLAGWVWQTNIEVTQLRNDLGDAEKQTARLEVEVEKHEDSMMTLVGVEKDITHIREILDRIESLVTK